VVYEQLKDNLIVIMTQ